MRTGTFLCTALLAALTPVSRPEGCGNSWINHNDVKAFAQLEPKTVAEKAAVRFNPTIVVSYGCYPYAMVNEEGQTSKGLKPSGPNDGHCKGSGHGSQVYVRSTWFRDIWATMYVYYSPKKQWFRGWNHRHGWDHATDWLNTPNATTTLAVTAGSDHNGKIFKASEKVGESVKLEFWQQGRSEIMLVISGKEGGKTLPLITWEQLPDKARCSLNEAKWINGVELMPLSDARFKEILTADWPFDE